MKTVIAVMLTAVALTFAGIKEEPKECKEKCEYVCEKGHTHKHKDKHKHDGKEKKCDKDDKTAIGESYRRIEFALPSQNDYAIYSIRGRLIADGKNLKDFQSINTDNLTAGVYFVRVKGIGLDLSKMILVQ